MALDFPANPVNGQVYDNFIYNSVKGTWKSISAGVSPTVLVNPTITNPIITNAVITATATNATTVPLTVNGAASQSSKLQEWKNSAGTTLASISSTGDFNLAAPIYSSSKIVGTTEPDGGSSGGIVVKAPASGSQTSAYLQFVNNAYTSQYAAIEATTASHLKLQATHVTMPSQPYFLAYGNAVGNITYSANSVLQFQNIRRQVGSSYNSSNGRFTAPVSGNYFLWFEGYNNGGQYRVSIRSNGGTNIFGQGMSATGTNFHQAGVTYLAAGDYVDVRNTYDNTVIYSADCHLEFGGMLLG